MAELREASSSGDLTVVKRLVECDNVQVDAGDDYGRTPLIFASWNGQLHVVEYLLDHGAQVDVADHGGSTALRFAASEGHLAILKLLIDRGATVNTADLNGWTPLRLATERGHVDIVKCLLEHDVDVDTRDNWGSSALRFAASDGRVEIMKLLVEIGSARVNQAEGHLGWTPLMLATWNGHINVVRYLLDHGADVDAKDNGGSTALREFIQPLPVKFDCDMALRLKQALSHQEVDGDHKVQCFIYQLLINRMQGIDKSYDNGSVRGNLNSVLGSAKMWIDRFEHQPTAVDLVKTVFRGFSLHRKIDRIVAEYFIVDSSEFHEWAPLCLNALQAAKRDASP
ncbi:Serine/threonine protein kinase [Phytophthora megakarya]|uniref:Serine/threonine protein kinase n=1 Tax=Phytophthora megakarya TaxID=4795 RepID=A0A225X0A0_9STRA|nr:Serine/threonine protein kinase [Phytophthora megakarya]